jgi:hypothetical protein
MLGVHAPAMAPKANAAAILIAWLNALSAE